MITTQTYNLTTNTPVLTESLKGELQHLVVLCDERVRLCIYARYDTVDIPIFDVWITSNCIIPLRLIGMNDDGAKLPYTSVEFALDGPLVIEAMGRTDVSLSCSIVLEE